MHKNTRFYLSEKDKNRIKSFIENPEKYATGTQKAALKISKLKKLAKEELTGDFKSQFDSALIAYDKALLSRERSDVTHMCPRCNSKMILREGKYGKFYGCSRFPYCKGTRHF